MIFVAKKYNTQKNLQSESESNEWVVENGLTSPDQVTLHIKRLLALFFWFYHNTSVTND